MASNKFSILRTPDDSHSSRVQDNVSATLTPIATALQKTPIMGAPPPPWVAPSLLNSWVNNGGKLAPIGYHRDALGYVHLRGHPKSGSLNAVVFTLPPGYRPAYSLDFYTPGFNGATVGCFVEVRINGDVFLGPPALTTDLSLDGIIFLAEA